MRDGYLEAIKRFWAAIKKFVTWVGGWKIVTAVLIAFVLGLWAGTAAAATGTISYTRPTTRVDGSPLLASEIASYSIACTYTPTGGVAAPCASLLPTSFSGTATGGTVTFTVAVDGRACFVLRTVDTGGRQSDPSAQACKDIVVAIPNPPGTVTVAVVLSMDHAPVYSLGSNNKLSTLMGFIPVGLPCVGEPLVTYRGAEFREVARQDVKFWGQTSLRVVAPCG